MRYALKIFYLGEGFSGSQRQVEKRTVEREFLSALEELKIDFWDFKTAGRTDQGVSSLGNVFALTTESTLTRPRILNSAMPMDIRVLSSHKVANDFNPRHARERIYKYFLLNEGYDLGKMREASLLFHGKKSFHNFSTTDHRNPVRTINRIEIIEKNGVLVLTFFGESFLWQMVRRIVTALKYAGRGEITPTVLERYFDLGFKKKFHPSEPENLVLWDVKLDFEFKVEEYSKKRLAALVEKKFLRLKNEAALWGEVSEVLKLL